MLTSSRSPVELRKLPIESNRIRTLESVGLLLRVGEAPTGKRTGGIYDVCSRPLRIQYDATRPAVAKAITAVSGSMVRLAHRDVVRAFRQKLVEPDGEQGQRSSRCPESHQMADHASLKTEPGMA